MSTDPTGLGNENCMSATEKKYINVGFDKTDWCSYDGDCLIAHLLFQDEICQSCVYKKPLPVPEILKEKMEERIRHDILWRKFTL